MSALRNIIFFIVFTCVSYPQITAAASKGYQLSLELTNYDSSEQVCLGYYYGVRYNLIDTIVWSPGKTITFEADTLLPEGAYLFWLAKSQTPINFVLPAQQQKLCLEVDAKNTAVGKIKVKKSKENKRFYEYLSFVSSKRPKLNQIQKELRDTTEEARPQLRKKMEAVYEEIAVYQRKLIKKYPGSMTAFLVSLDLGPKIPNFDGTPEEVLKKKAQYQRQHYFENINVDDPRLLRTTMFMRKANAFVHQVTPQHPDSVYQAVTKVFKLIENQPTVYQYTANFLLKTFDRPKVIGMDEVYVRLIEDYVSTGKLSWKKADEVAKLEADARRRKPTLIGNKIPNLELQKEDGSKLKFHDVDAEYIVLYVWRPNCGYCKKATPFIKSFYEKYKDQGVQVIGACTLTGDKMSKCWDYIKEKELPYINLLDPSGRSRFVQKLNAGRTPKIFILDKDKNILVKDFKGEQLELVFERLKAQGNKWF